LGAGLAFNFGAPLLVVDAEAEVEVES